jgi:hypothetical protein
VLAEFSRAAQHPRVAEVYHGKELQQKQSKQQQKHAWLHRWQLRVAEVYHGKSTQQQHQQQQTAGGSGRRYAQLCIGRSGVSRVYHRQHMQ